jgi:ABC-type transport system substrate-binding protein
MRRPEARAGRHPEAQAGTRTVRRREFLQVAAVGTVGTMLAACSPAAPPPSRGAAPDPAAPSTARPTEWSVVLGEATGGGDPLTEYSTSAEYYLQKHVLEGLLHVELLPDGKSWGVVNDLAERWSFPDSKTFLAELRQGVRFHNGEELTAEHVEYAYNAMVFRDKPGRRTILLKALGKLEIVDKYTVRWHMPAPDLTILGSLYGLTLPALARKNMSADEFERQPIGTGPYRAIEWQRDGTVRLEAWDGYRLGKPFPEKLTIRAVPEASTRTMELLAGSAQIAQSIPIESLPSLQGDANLDLVSLQGSSALSYVINVYKTTPPLRDKRVRQAMNYAVNREAIVRSILGGRGTPLPGPLSPGWLGYTDDVKPYPHDPERARALLAEAGYADGFAFDWTITDGVYVKDAQIAQAVAGQLAQVGIKANLQVRERARLLADRNEGNFDVTELNWPVRWIPTSTFAFTVDAAYPDSLVAKWGETPPALVRARKLIQEAGDTTTVEQMGRAYAELNRHMHDEAFWLFVHTVDDLWGIQRATGWRPYPSDYPVYYDRWGLLGKQAPAASTVPLIP